MGRCIDCGEQVKDGLLGSYREIKGWEKVRSKGGGNAIALRKETGFVMCGGCGERRKLHDRAGITQGQTSLEM